MAPVKEIIIRNLEYLCGGIDTLRTLGESGPGAKSYNQLFNDWKTILCDTIEEVEECAIIEPPKT